MSDPRVSCAKMAELILSAVYMDGSCGPNECCFSWGSAVD